MAENVTFGTTPVAGSFRMEPGERQSLPFAFPVPWQCPFTSVGGWTLRGMRLGVRTRVDVPGAVDPGDLDALSVEPLPVQTAVLQALEQLGFGFRRADVERGRLRGSDLPFYQEVEFAPPGHLRRSINELEVTFLADPAGCDVVLEVDRRGGLLTEGRDAAGRLRVQHHDTAASVSRDLDAAVQRLGRRRGWL